MKYLILFLMMVGGAFAETFKVGLIADLHAGEYEIASYVDIVEDYAGLGDGTSVVNNNGSKAPQPHTSSAHPCLTWRTRSKIQCRRS